MVDLAIGLGVPTLAMIRCHRSDIIENVGCYPATYSTLLSVPMFYMWPIFIGFINIIHATLTVIELVNRRLQLSLVLSASKAGLNTPQYLRLMVFAATDLMLSLPLSIYILITNLRAVQTPWISWDDTHQNFGRINCFSSAFVSLRPSFYLILQILRWAPPALGIMFFLCFGVAGEAIAEYRRWFWALAGLFGKRPNATYGPNWSNRLKSHAPPVPRTVSFPLPRPTHSMEREPKNDVESQLHSRDTLGLDNPSKSGPKPLGL